MRANYKLPRLFLDAALAGGIVIDADSRQSNYLLNVLRLEEGAELLVFNGREGEWLAHVTRPAKKRAAITLAVQTRPQPEPGDLVYCFAPLKAGRLDYKPLQGHTAASLRWTTEGYRGRFAAVSIRKRGSEISVVFQERWLDEVAQ